jgi:Flp pilus assembly protein TadD
VRITVRDRAGHQGRAALPLEIAPAAGAEPGRPAQVAQAARDEARRAYAMATLARLQDNWSAAEKQLIRATEADPDYGRAWVDLGGVYLKSGRWESAVDVYRKACRLLPASTNAPLGLARAQAARGDLDGAAGTLESLLERTPADGDGWLLYGDVLARSGDREQARRCWLKALALGGGRRGQLAAIQQRLRLKP